VSEAAGETTAPLALRTLEDARDPRWDAFVFAEPEATFYHLLGWRRVLEQVLGLTPHYLYTERGGRITGVLPLFMSGRWPFTAALVSVPVGVGGGIASSDPESALLLRAGARAIAEREGAAYVEYKTEKKRFDDLPSKSGLYLTFRQPLFPDREQQLAQIPRKTRAMIREAERARLRADYNRSDLEPFYDLVALSYRNLGTPMFPRPLFVALLEEFPDADFVTVTEAGRIIGAVMNFYFRDVMLPFFSGALPEARDVAVNNYLYWYMLMTGWQRGFRTFDFGRSKIGTGACQFKRNFGVPEYPVEYQYDLVRAAELPNVNPTNPRYKRAIEAWQRLPVGLSKVVGPLISSRLP
jgi:FemAB-related protein (PEP-CTERM system-associated)